MSPPTLLTIPREMRQHILKYAFDDAGVKDLKLNERLRLILRAIVNNATILGLPGALELFDLALGSGTPDDGPLLPGIFPNIHKLAQVLKLTCSELEEDMLFVLKSSLELYAKVNEDPGDSWWDDYWGMLTF